MSNNLWGLTLFIVGFSLLTSCQPESYADISSPDGKTKVHFAITEDGQATYQVAYSGEELIAPSAMGFTLSEQNAFEKGLSIESIRQSSYDETWEQVWGEVSSIRNHYIQAEVSLRNPENLKLKIVFRVYNNGVGFRYLFPEQQGLQQFDILEEHTHFNLAQPDKAWWIPGNPDSYEYSYQNSRVSEIDSANTPITIQCNNGVYLSLHEAALTDYAGMRLRKSNDHISGLKSDLVPWPDGIKVKANTPFKTPWRTIQIGNTPGELITNYLILNLNEPNKLENTDWIKPLKYVGVWWSLHLGVETWIQGDRHGANTENVKRYIDFAAQNSIEGVLAEGWNQGWENWGTGEPFDFVTPYPDFDIEAVLAYANYKNISIIGHHENGGNVESYEKHLISALDELQSQGIHHLKTGYAGGIVPKGQHHHGQWMVRHYRRVVEEAAKRQISINAHEPIKPTGLRRTYPNMMTREGVRGMEWNAWSEGNTPEHHTVLPFTRMLAGPIDYTPGIFDILYRRYDRSRERWHPNDKGGARVHTTLAKQLALYVVLYSPWQMAADMVENYSQQPAFQFIRDVPVDWDETKVINGEIGEFVTIARRNGPDWFVGSVTDEQPRTITFSLDFLESGQTYEIITYADAEETNLEHNPEAISISKSSKTKDDQITLHLGSGGGAAIQLKPI
ncbi:MAG: glycoside hydrolase family 97 protein [Cyclobacteriaceae bacterium]|nr:glycoside hydrolase family 97 protein [Cyclobacteriaceae bacterium HetDA_MAG_MS6]